MKKIIFLFVMFGFVINIQAQYNDQAYTIKLLPVKFKDNYRAAKKLNEGVKLDLVSDFNLGYYADLQLKVEVSMGKAHLIEGMDVKVVGKPELVFTMLNTQTKKKEKHIFSKELSAKSKAEMGTELVDAYLADDTARKAVNTFVLKFSNQQYKDCGTIFTKVEGLRKQKKYDQSLRLLMNLKMGSCKEKALIMETTILKEQSEENCATKIQKASIMINSGVSFQMKRAIPLLMSISPSAPCADEALALSKKIGEKMEKTQQISTDLQRYQNYYQGHNDQWQRDYLERLLGKR